MTTPAYLEAFSTNNNYWDPQPSAFERTDTYWNPSQSGGMNLSRPAPVHTPYVPPVRPAKVSTSRSGSVSGYDSKLASIFANLQKASPTVTQNTTQTTKQNPSADMENMIANLTNQINTLSQNTSDAYGGVYNTFDDLLRSLADRYNTQGSAASTNAANTAISSGLTPAEANSLSQEALLQVMQEYNPAQAQLANQQAMVPVAEQGALAQLMQSLTMPMAQTIQSPYYQNVAGQVQTGQQTTTDPLKKAGLLANLAAQMDQMKFQESQSQTNNDLGWAQLAQRALEAQQNYGLNASKLGMQGSQFDQSLAQSDALARLGESGATQRAALEAQLRQLLRGDQQQFAAEQANLSFDRRMEEIIKRYELENPDDTTGDEETV